MGHTIGEDVTLAVTYARPALFFTSRGGHRGGTEVVSTAQQCLGSHHQQERLTLCSPYELLLD